LRKRLAVGAQSAVAWRYPGAGDSNFSSKTFGFSQQSKTKNNPYLSLFSVISQLLLLLDVECLGAEKTGQFFLPEQKTKPPF
jgi:hypothetical protein